jgi:hypothetical protein
LDPTEGKTGKDFVTRAELLKLHKRVLEHVRKMTQEEGFRSLVASGIYTAEGKLAKNMAASVSLESLPVILETPHFAMKDGTVINLFVQKMLRLSVDMPLLNF